MVGQPGFFDTDARLRALSATGDPLARLAAVVDFELFRPELEAALARGDRSRGGRPPYDAALMFRILILQALYTLSDDQAEYRLRDRLSFMRFASLAPHEPVPDAKTIWPYREQLTRAGALTRAFDRFDAMLREQGYLAMGGQIVDATVVEARRPRLNRDEKQAVREGVVPSSWPKARTRRIDREGRWTIKRGRKKAHPPPGSARQRTAATGEIAVPVFGYKNHLGIDRMHGFIRRFAVTHATRHDGSQLGAILDPQNTASDVWADTAYRSKANLALLRRRGLRPQFPRVKPCGRPMPPPVARGNRTRARVRGRVEHVFAAEKCGMGLVVRTIGLARATAKITLAKPGLQFTTTSLNRRQTRRTRLSRTLHRGRHPLRDTTRTVPAPALRGCQTWLSGHLTPAPRASPDSAVRTGVFRLRCGEPGPLRSRGTSCPEALRSSRPGLRSCPRAAPLAGPRWVLLAQPPRERARARQRMGGRPGGGASGLPSSAPP